MFLGRNVFTAAIHKTRIEYTIIEEDMETTSNEGNVNYVHFCIIQCTRLRSSVNNQKTSGMRMLQKKLKM